MGVAKTLVFTKELATRNFITKKHWKANSTEFVRAALVLSSQIFFSQGYNPAVVTLTEHLGSEVLTAHMAEHPRQQCQQGWLLRPLFLLSGHDVTVSSFALPVQRAYVPLSFYKNIRHIKSDPIQISPFYLNDLHIPPSKIHSHSEKLGVSIATEGPRRTLYSNTTLRPQTH